MIIYTAVYGDFDVLKRHADQSVDCKYYCVTDNPNIKMEEGAQWEIILQEGIRNAHPRIQAKYRRTHPFELFPDEDTVIYIDGSGTLKSKDSIERFLNIHNKECDITAFKHPQRDTVLAEVIVSEGIGKYKRLPIIEQYMHYRKEGFEDNIGLSATGLLIYNKSDKLINMLSRWFGQNLEWTYQDQISFEYCIRKYGIKRNWIEFNQMYNRYVSFLTPHLSDK